MTTATATLAHQLAVDPLVKATRVFSTMLAGHLDCGDACPWVQAVARAVWTDPQMPAYDLDGCVGQPRD